jgi:hypothetical protein
MAAITRRGADDLAAAGHVTNGCTRGGHRVWDDRWVSGAARVIRVDWANSGAAWVRGVQHRKCRMGWATQYITQLREGETVQFRPRGNSMAGKIESGQLCTVEPVADPAALRVGGIVLCKVNACQYIHLIKAIQGSRFQIGNNRGRVNGWITANSIYGKCVKVES